MVILKRAVATKINKFRRAKDEISDIQKEGRGLLSNAIKNLTKKKKKGTKKMGFVYEVVKEEDRELFNSFLPSRKANRNTMWVADKERNIYFFSIGGEARECIEEYFLAWNDLKKYIYTVEKMYRDNKDIRTAHIWINTISMPNKLNNDKEKIKEIVNMIQEILQMTYKSQIIFERVVEPYFRKEDN